MKKMVAVAVALLVLTGCSADPVDVEESLEHIESKDEQAAEAETGEIEQPIQAEPEPEPELEAPEVAFLEGVRLHTDRPTLVNATDEQLIEAGKLACERLAENPAINEIQIIDGEVEDDNGRYWDSMAIATNANTAFCPDIQLTRTPPTG